MTKPKRKPRRRKPVVFKGKAWVILQRDGTLLDMPDAIFGSRKDCRSYIDHENGERIVRVRIEVIEGAK